MKKILFLLIIFITFACSRDKKLSSPLDFKEYITAYSSGIVSKDDAIKVLLSKKISKEKQKELLNKNLFDISPKISGKLQIFDSEVIFVPEQPLKSDTEYHITLNLFKIFDIKDENQENFNFKIRTKKANFKVELLDLESYNKDLYFLNAMIKSSDNINLKDIENIVWANVDGKPLKIKNFTKDEKSTQIPIIIDSIPASFEKNQIVEVEWNGSKINFKAEGKTNMLLPNASEFKVVKVLQNNELNQFQVVFNQPLAKNQDYRGLILIANEYEKTKVDLKFSTAGNALKVYNDNHFDINTNLLVSKGIKGLYGGILQENFSQNLTFFKKKPKVEWAKNGTILPSSENLKVYFKTINLKAVEVSIYRINPNNVLQFLQQNNLSGDYQMRYVASPLIKKIVSISEEELSSLNQWQTHALDLSSLIKPEMGAIYSIKINIKKEFCTSCGDESLISEEILPFEEEKEYEDYYHYDDDYDWNERENPCHSSFYYGKSISTNLLASDLGVIVKGEQNNKLRIYVNDILTTKPVNGCFVEFFDFQQQKIGEGKTSSDGILEIELNKKAFFVSVKKDASVTYVRILDSESLSISRFNTSGLELKKGRNGYIYTERGVYRPGDDIFVGFIFNDYFNKLPENHPIKVQLLDPFGKVYKEIIQNSTKENHYIFKLNTPNDAQTGAWECVVKAGGGSFSKSIKIETIKPNRLKIENSLNEKIIDRNGANGSISVNWLQGMPAEGSKVELSAKLYNQPAIFKGFEDFTFENTSEKFQEQEIQVFNGSTNDNGVVNFNFQPKNLEGAKSHIKVNFIAKAQESGGDFSTDVATATLSPFSNYVGIKKPKENSLGFYDTNKNVNFEIVTLSQDGKIAPFRNCNAYLFKIDYNWWWDISEENISTYTASQSRSAVSTSNFKTDKNGRENLSFNISDEDWGVYFILIEDSQSKHTTGIIARFDYGYGNRANSTDATMLSVGTDKREYNLGETISVVFPSSQGGRALISVETASKIIQNQWVETKEGETSVQIKATEEFAPNVYISVSLLQPHAQTLNDAPIRLFGVTPVLVKNEKSILMPQITMSDVLRPEQKVKISVKEKNGQPMSYSLMIVEEGLLNLTRFKTPNPWHSFFVKSALGIRTWDIYNDVIGAFSGTLNQVFAIGGDENLGEMEPEKANRFKPLVLVNGVFTTNGGQKTHEITLPNYIGQARVMVVASNVEKNAFGNAEKSVAVRSPLMVLASLPRKTAPFEEITLPVTIFAMENHIKNAKISIKTNENFSVEGENAQNVFFETPSEKMAYFKLKPTQQGIGKVYVEAVSGSEKAYYEVEMDIFNPNPITHKVSSFTLDAKATQEFSYELPFESKNTKAILEISSFAPLNLSKRLEYLTQYPHGCAEQMTSGAFAELFLSDFVLLTDEYKEKMQESVSQTITKLSDFQLQNGGFAYWKGGEFPNEWVTSYIGQFLALAQKKGFVVSSQTKQKWLDFEKTQARNWTNISETSALIQAFRLYSLAMAGQSDISSMNRLREIGNISSEAKHLISAAYALSGQKKIAKEIFNASFDNNEKALEETFGSLSRSQALALHTSILIDDKEISREFAQKISEKISSEEWLSTQTTAYCLFAMSEFIKKNKQGNSWEVNFTQNKTQNLKTDLGFVSQRLDVNSKNNKFKLQNKSELPLFVRVITSGRLPLGEEIEFKKNLNISVNYLSTQNQILNPYQIKQGTSFVIDIKVENTSNLSVKNVALTQFLPSGWEVINTRFAEESEASNTDNIDILDSKAMFYFPLKAKETKRFKLKVNASYLGKYYLSGTTAEAMYDDRFSTRLKGHWVEVVK